MAEKRKLSPELRAEIWRLRRMGRSTSSIAHGLGLYPELVRWVWAQHGGIEPRARRRRATSLNDSEREEISRGLAAQETMRSMARRLGRSPSTISREIQRNGGPGRYRAHEADQAAWRRARRRKTRRLEGNVALRVLVEERLRANWSPEQIAAWLKCRYPNDLTQHVSHETIYKSLFIQAKGTLKRELCEQLRTRRRIRRAKGASDDARGQIPDAISIRERPAEVADRAVPGHWEGDLISGSRNSYVATLVERHTRFVMLVKVPNKTTSAVVAALIDRIHQLPAHLRRTLTWDRGAELKRHKEITLAADMDVYFCDPASPWQRGTNENTNGLLRQYFPKGMNLHPVTQSELDAVADQLNTRPRKTLAWSTPADKMNELLR